MARHKKRRKETFDDHMALSIENVRGVLKFFNIPEGEFSDWIGGQTCPICPDGNLGFFWWDVKRFIDWKTKGVLPIWD